MKIAIGSDHGGFALKEAVRKHLEEKGIAEKWNEGVTPGNASFDTAACVIKRKFNRMKPAEVGREIP